MLLPNDVDRSSDDYLTLLHEKLNIDDLIATAIPIDNDPNYEKVIRIDFCGISGSTLLLNDDDPKAEKIRQRFVALFENISSFDEKRIKLHIRFIFLYLYSDFAFAQIEAEKTKYRATIKNPQYNQMNLSLYSLSADDIRSSMVYTNQLRALNIIQDIHNRFYLHRKRSDILNVKFTCLPLNFCLLTINKDTFIDPYSYAKESLNSYSLSYKTPLSFLNYGNKNFALIEDHFRFIWNHPTTLVFEDGTHANTSKNSGVRLVNLDKIKLPHEVNFYFKGQILKGTIKNSTDEDINKWKFQLEKMFDRMTRTIEPLPDEEALFIGFSKNNGKEFVDKISDFIETDFAGWLRINIVDLDRAKETLFKDLIEKMRSSTIGLFVFTKDISHKEGKKLKYYSRPNVYLEYGYMMRHLKKHETTSGIPRLIVFAEKELTIATDFQDLPRIELSGKPVLDYGYILTKIINLHKTLTREIAQKVKDNYLTKVSVQNLGANQIVAF